MEVSIFIIAYFVLGCAVAVVLFLVKKAGRSRVVSPVNGSVDQNCERLYQRFFDDGLQIEEYEPLDGRQLKVVLDHPSKVRFWCTGIILLAIGILLGIVWFMFGRDTFSITLKEEHGFVCAIFESNSKHASKVWQKINFKLSTEMLEKLDKPPDGVETTVEVV